MSMLVKCNKCGNMETLNSNGDLPRESLMGIVKIEYPHRASKSIENYHLCDDCVKALHGWMTVDNGTETNEIKTELERQCFNCCYYGIKLDQIPCVNCFYKKTTPKPLFDPKVD